MIALIALASVAAGQIRSTTPRTVTPVSGESWLNHLQRPLDQTAMGKTDRLGPSPEAPGGSSSPPSALSGDRTTLYGADLFRLNCRGCHGEAGLGAPPEISSVISAVRASSAPLVMARMKSLGATMSRREVFQLANESKAALLHRIHDGGKDMPSFSYLNEAEVQSLMAYLNVLAGVPGSRQIAVPETQARIGELIAKSTCHICHSATGRNPTPEQLAAGAIPPLNTLTARVTREELIHKVADGAPVAMGGDGLTFRGRMPVFFYLSQADAADVYEYLRAYPPSELAGSAAGAALTERPPGAEAAQAPSALSHAADRRSPAEKPAGFTPGDWLWSLSIAVLTVLGATFFVTVRKVQRLSAEAHARNRALVSPMPVAVYFAFRSWGGETSDDPGNANDRAYSEHTEAHLP